MVTTIKEFLSFDIFVTKYILIFFYYLFALLLPVVLYYFKQKIEIKFKIKSWMIVLVLIVLAELFMRMFFEMLIGYFDMHDYLFSISKRLG